MPTKLLKWLACTAVPKACGLMLLVTATAGTARADLTFTPELNPGSLASAMTLLAGGLLMFTDRIRRK